MDKRMMMQKLQQIHHASGELMQMMGEMGQREGYQPGSMGMRENGQYQGYNDRSQGGSNGMGQRMPYVDPFMY